MHWMDRAAKQAVIARLAGVRGGVIETEDRGEISVFGRDEAGAQREALRARVVVKDDRFWRRAALGGSLGVAEAYLDGWWQCDDLTAMLRIFVRDMPAADAFDQGWSRLKRPLTWLAHRLRRNSRVGSRRNIHEHYDLGNAFFALMLDESMTYSCGWFASPTDSLRDAQIAKIHRLCGKLQLTERDHLLEIGTGWGSCALHAARHFGCKVTTTTISQQQFEIARQRVLEAGLDDRVNVVMRDYRDLDGVYDKIISIEMIEAVGHEYLPTYFQKCCSLLKPGGRMALQAITMPDDRYEAYRRSPDFIQRYVFPGSCCPSMGAMNAALKATGGLCIHDVDSIGEHYVPTLRHWRERFFARIDEVRALGYPERFVRMWDYYLCYCEAGFAERYIDDVQMTLVKDGRSS